MLQSTLLLLQILHLYKPMLGAQPVDWDIRANVLPPLESNSRLSNSNQSMKSEQPITMSESRAQVKDCLEMVRRCGGQGGICKVDLEIFKQFCGDWLDERSLSGCQPTYVKECRSALKTVNHGRPNLRHCTCDGQASRSIEDLSRCNLLRRNLNSHPCLQEPPIWLRPTQPFQRPTIQNVDKKDTDSPTETKNGAESPSGERTLVTPKPIRNDTELVEGEELQPLVDITTTPTTTTSSTEDKINRVPQPDPTAKYKPGSAREPVERYPTGNLDKFPSNVMPPTLSCLSLLEQCISQASCARALNRFRAMCAPRSCNKLRSQCLSAHREFARYNDRMNCTCRAEMVHIRQQRCVDFKLSVLHNECADSRQSESILETTFFDLPKINEGSQVKAIRPTQEAIMDTIVTESSIRFVEQPQTGDEKKEITQTVPINCFVAFHECVRNPSCLWYYLRLASLCTWPVRARQCLLPASCAEVVKRFYSHMADYVYRALTCDCQSTEDADCLAQKAIFRPSCGNVQKSENQTTLVQCSEVWQQCRRGEVCRESMKFLLSQCASSSVTCRTQANICLDAQRQFRANHNYPNECQCGRGEVFSLGDSIPTVPCESFQRVLGQAPCAQIPKQLPVSDYEPSDPHTRACFLTHRLKLTKDTTVRIYDPTTKDQLSTSGCSKLCTCSRGCQHRLCSTAIGTPATELLGFASTDSTLYGQRAQGKNNLSPCRYMPIVDASCSCDRDGVVQCDLLRKLGSRTLMDYQVILHYDQDELATIVELLNENLLNRELVYFTRLVRIGPELMSLMSNMTGMQQCHLLLSSHRQLPRRRDELRRLNSVGAPEASYIDQRQNGMSNQGQLTYAITFDRYASEPYSNQVVFPGRRL